MKRVSVVFMGFMAMTLIGSLFGTVSASHAQSSQAWSEPINVSNSGSSTNPSLTVDSKGMIHAIWLDEIDGYKYAQSTNGVEWSSPKTVKFPFSKDIETPPLFLSDTQGGIFILWRDQKGVLNYRKATETSFGDPIAWKGSSEIAESVIGFTAIVDAQGTLYVAYITGNTSDDGPPGVYYRRLDITGWSLTQKIYTSSYFRSLEPADANVQLALSTGTGNVFIVWDDRSQKRVFFASSSDRGDSWNTPLQVRGPEDSSGLELPYNINVSATEENILLTWQLGIPGDRCTMYSQSSSDQGAQFSEPMRVLDEFQSCPVRTSFIVQNKDYSVVMLETQNDFSLVAWNGSSWSDANAQSELLNFLNPLTLDNVLLACPEMAYSAGNLFAIGCDINGGDIWFASRPLGGLETWFPSPSAWTSPSQVTEVKQAISDLASTGHKNAIHDFWIQYPTATEDPENGAIQYARWVGSKWSNPTTILSGYTKRPMQLAVDAGPNGKLLLTWVDGESGDILFSWANSENANSNSEWKLPVYIPSFSQVNSAPDVLADASGRIIIAYAVPSNEYRGIYIVQSTDGGVTWSEPYLVFDAVTVAWDIVDQPIINLTGDGRLHILFGRYSLRGGERQSAGLFYVQSADGGLTWSGAETVSEKNVVWSKLLTHGSSDIHRLWQEKNKVTLVTYHQASQDGGTTWSSPIKVSNVVESTALNAGTIDQLGDVHYFQISGGENPTVMYHKWTNSAWTPQPSNEFVVRNQTIPLSMDASFTSEGQFLVSVLLNQSVSRDEITNNIWSTGQQLEFSGSLPTPVPFYVATVQATSGANEESPLTVETPTGVAPLAGVDTSTPIFVKYRNLIGLLFLGGIFSLLLIIFRPFSKKPYKPSDTSK